MLINPKLCPIINVNSRSISQSSDYNICSVKLLNCTPQTTLVTVYRPRNANADDSAALFQDLNAALLSSRCFIFVGYFNIIRNWRIPVVPCAQRDNGALSHFILGNDLIQHSMLPSRRNYSNILDLIMVFQCLSSSMVIRLPPIADSDHYTQLICTPLISTRDSLLSNMSVKINYNKLQYLLKQLHWQTIFQGVCDVNDYVEIFSYHVQECIANMSIIDHRKKFNSPDLRKSIVWLIQKSKLSGVEAK